MKHLKLFESFIKERQLDLFADNEPERETTAELDRMRELGVGPREKVVYFESPLYVRQDFSRMMDRLQSYDPRQAVDILSDFGIEAGYLLDSYDRNDEESVDNFWNELEQVLQDESSKVELQYSNIDLGLLEQEIVKDFNESNLFQYMEDGDNPVSKIEAVGLTEDGNFKVRVVFDNPASDFDIERAKEFLTGQYSDGWGEGFEQREIRDPYSHRGPKPDYYVSAWDASDDWFIRQTS